MNHFFQEYPSTIVPSVHLDTMLVIIRYSTLCFDNNEFTKYLNRSMNMTNTYIEYVKMIDTKSPEIIANECLQLILNRFPAVIPANRTNINASIDFNSEIAMCVFLDTIKKDVSKYYKNERMMNALAEEIYHKVSNV